jgi:hypothetical protein
MARFLVLFDRSVRRVRRKKRTSESRTVESRDEAQAILQQWAATGAEYTNLWEWNDRFHLWARWAEEVIRTPHGTAMPRGKVSEYRNPLTGWVSRSSDLTSKLGLHGRPGTPPRRLEDLPEPLRRKLERFRLFSIHTRNYLRRRAWRYFRKLGKQHPERYAPAVTAALKLYEDVDVADGLALLDNWGLIHILFHHSPVLVARTNGWRPAQGHTLAELTPAPIYEALWQKAPRALFELVKEARSRPVRQWAIRLLRRDPAGYLANVPLDELLGLLSHEDAEVAELAAEVLPHVRGLGTLAVDRWLALLDTPNPSALDILCTLMATHVQSDQVTLTQAVQLAASRPVPVARLGLHFLQGKTPRNEAECRTLLGLAEAQAEPVRAEIVRWVRGVLSQSQQFQVAWVLDYLDSRHRDVRVEGWAWFQGEPRARDDVELWQRLLESPYDDVRLNLIDDLQGRLAQRGPAWSERVALNPELVRYLWAAVLLNIHRGSRTKPVVVHQLVHRLEQRPDEAPVLFPILSVALRSVRGPEWRAGLAGVVQLVERHPELEPTVQGIFPELKLAVG